MSQQHALTSTTAPGKVFESRAELAEHYKSDWHKYNLKRREAGLPLLGQADFQARWEAALALKRERESQQERSGTDHLKKNNKSKKNRKGQRLGGRAAVNSTSAGVVAVSQAAAYEKIKADSAPPIDEAMETEKEEDVTEEMIDDDEDEDVEEEEPPVIEPRQCLFDRHISKNVDMNIARMQQKYGFFVPDAEYLVDPVGLIGYCHEKIKLGHVCLYCQRIFRTWEGCQKHMVSTRHTKLRYERGIDLDEFDPFYDFTEADEEFLGYEPKTEGEEQEIADNNEDIDEEEWEDVSDDEDEELMDEDDDDLYAGYEDEIQKYGFDVTPLGELIFPDGRIVGHRGLARYYKQHYRPNHGDRTAVLAARRAAGERLYNGRVYNLNSSQDAASTENALSLARAGVAPGAAAGRAGKGILVSAGAGGYTALSLYRYKAVVNKARRDDARGQRLQHKTKTNINRMDKKANRLYNNVSVAHAKR